MGASLPLRAAERVLWMLLLTIRGCAGKQMHMSIDAYVVNPSEPSPVHRLQSHLLVEYHSVHHFGVVDGAPNLGDHLRARHKQESDEFTDGEHVKVHAISGRVEASGLHSPGSKSSVNHDSKFKSRSGVTPPWLIRLPHKFQRAHFSVISKSTLLEATSLLPAAQAPPLVLPASRMNQQPCVAIHSQVLHITNRLVYLELCLALSSAPSFSPRRKAKNSGNPGEMYWCSG